MLIPIDTFKNFPREAQSDELMFQQGVYTTDECYSELIEKLGDPTYTPTDADYINLAVKHMVALLTGNEDDTLSEDVVTNLYHHFCHISAPKLNPKKYHILRELFPKESARMYELEYQLRMLADLPATAALSKEIIEGEYGEYGSERFRAIDFGSGSAILTVAGAIRAMRKGYKISEIDTLGIEMHTPAYRVSERLIRSLRLGKVLHTTSQNAILARFDGLQGREISLIINENLPTRGFPFFHRWHDGEKTRETHEPFFEIIAMMRAQYSEQVMNLIPQFPKSLIWTDWATYTNTEEYYNQRDSLPIWKSEQGYGVEKLVREGSDRENLKLETTVPVSIFIGSDMEELPIIGFPFKSMMNHPNPRRWANLPMNIIRERYQSLSKK